MTDPIMEMFDALLGEGWTAEPAELIFVEGVGTCLPLRPKAGDVIRVDGPYWGAEIGRRAVIDSHMYDEDLFMAVLGASAHRPPDGAYVRCSGGPCPAIHLRDLTYVGMTEQRFWRWLDFPRKDGGVDYTEIVNLWSWTPPERER